MVAVSDFSGLTSSACALASAAARAANDSLDRGMGGLPRQEIETHRPRFRALCSYAMPDGLLGVLRHQGLELTLCPLMVKKGAAGVAEESGKFRPGIRRAHIDDVDGLNAWPRRLDAEEARGRPVLDAAPEFLLRGQKKVLVERIA